MILLVAIIVLVIVSFINRRLDPKEEVISETKEEPKETDLRSEIAKGVRDGIAKSNYEHGESFGNYGSSDYLFK